MSRTLLSAFVLVAVVGVTGCGGDDPDPTASDSSASEPSASESDATSGDDSMDSDAAREAKAAKSIAEDLLDGSDDDLPLTPTQATCAADGMVAEIGVDRLIEAGVLTEDLEVADEEEAGLDRADAETASGAMVECTGTKLYVNAILEQAGDVPPETAACVKGVVDEQLLREVFTKAFQGADDDEVGRPMVAAVEGCE
jgi:hypothetical protein